MEIKKVKEKIESYFLPIIFWLIVLFALFSVLILLTLLVECLLEWKIWKFDWSSEGITNFIDVLIQFKEVFAATIILTGVYLVIKQIQLAQNANRISSWIDWQRKFENDIKSELGGIHKKMAQFFINSSKEMHDYFFTTNMIIKDKEHLTEYFSKFIASKVVEFEKKTDEYKDSKKANTLYSNGVSNYSYQGYFKRITDLIARPSMYYTSYKRDLKELYTNQVRFERNEGNL